MALLARVAARGVRPRVRRPERWPLPTSIHYYHFDGLGSVIALTNSSGSVVNLYEYSVYGEVSASDPNHPNRFLFTGREFDKDTGLYYYRARYYNPYIGRFLQTDPAGDGMNPYAYCSNNPTGATDPSGMASNFHFFRVQLYLDNGDLYHEGFGFSWTDDRGEAHSWEATTDGGMDEWLRWAGSGGEYYDDEIDEKVLLFPEGWEVGQLGWTLASRGGDTGWEKWWFWRLWAVALLDDVIAKGILEMEGDKSFTLLLRRGGQNKYDPASIDRGGTLTWFGGSPAQNNFSFIYSGDPPKKWYKYPLLAMLAHELAHAHHNYKGTLGMAVGHHGPELYGVRWENRIRQALFNVDPSCSDIFPRPGYRPGWNDWGPTAVKAWDQYRWFKVKW